MNRSFLVQRLIVMFFIVIFSPVLAKGAVDSPLTTQTVRDLSSSKSEESVCRAVKKAIKEGQNERTLVKTAIELGHNACFVIKCAVLADGKLEYIINGANDAGVTSDVLSKCCISAGCDPKELARILATVEPQEPTDELLNPERVPQLQFISPSSF